MDVFLIRCKKNQNSTLLGHILCKLDLSSLTIYTEFGNLDLGEVCALVESLTGEFQPILLPGDLVGHVGHGCHPTIVSLQTQSTHDSSVGGQTALVSGILSLRKERKKKSGRKTTHTGLSWRIQMAN